MSFLCCGGAVRYDPLLCVPLVSNGIGPTKKSIVKENKEVLALITLSACACKVLTCRSKLIAFMYAYKHVHIQPKPVLGPSCFFSFFFSFCLLLSQAALGLDRIRAMATGSAPVATHVLTFMRILIGVKLLEG